jgi:hypothetical protein
LKNYPITHWCQNNREVDKKFRFSVKVPEQSLKARIEQEKKKSKQHILFKKSKKKKN